MHKSFSRRASDFVRRCGACLPAAPTRIRAAFVAACAALAIALPAAAAIDEADLLPVDQAFVLDAQATSPDTIRLRWRVADGYYLYRHRTSVQADPAFAAQPLQLPKGKAYRDEFFGDVETYRKELVATLPGRAGPARVNLTVKYQGCADAGICYPPQTRKLTVAMPVATAAGDKPLVSFGNARGGANPLVSGNARNLPLPAEQAFGVEAIARDADTLLVRFTPAPGYYLYRDKTALRLEGVPGASLGPPRWPRGVAHRDEHFGAVTVFFDPVDVAVPVRRGDAGAVNARLVVNFQGCQTDGICYPPMTRTLDVALPAGSVTADGATAGVSASTGSVAAPTGESAVAAPASAVVDTTGAAPSAAALDTAGASASTAGTAAPAPATTAASGVSDAADAGPVADDRRLADALAGPSRLWTLMSFLGFGVLLAFTPCVLPMVPILSGLIAGRGPGLGARRAFVLSLVYVLANAAVFTVAGVVAGLAGANLQILFQAPWAIGLFAALFVALALSSFGLYELQMPAGLRNRLGALTNQQHGGSWAGVAVMGALSALIVGPCVAPPLAAAVLYIGQTQDPMFGGAALFLLALGMGLPLLAFGAAAGRGLPTTGPWMIGVQRAFGFVFLGLAVWMLERVLPGPITLALWGALLLGAAAMLAVTLRHARTPSTGRATLGWTAALLLGLTGTAQLVGALAGSHDPLRPLAGLRGGATHAELPFRMIKSSADLDREIAAAQAAGRPLLLDFYADWCVACKEMERDTFPDPRVHAALQGFVLIKADVTANDALDQALMTRLGIVGPPATLYFVDGAEQRGLRLFGFEPPVKFAARAQQAAR
ncbi:protein-disulfide reductase DsbD [Cognatilysobacter bugurensis]|uniref:Thiol:disulfide interchange protein DsbD n=1 Tax=Cognatilysobacter bugurensis TaxID=543356 RepID=A0A918SZH1_9GAMM|nr:protein-disulfide reductase DsbD [Lysobacter bugurensis]GHA80874.1 cytochrome c biogenesis protein [Lysobacter bugurensis]